jgi:hypothetical protein
VFKPKQLIIVQREKRDCKRLAAELLLKNNGNREMRQSFVALNFYGPGKTKGFTNAMIFENLKKGKIKSFLKDVILTTYLLLMPA